MGFLAAASRCCASRHAQASCLTSTTLHSSGTGTMPRAMMCCLSTLSSAGHTAAVSHTAATLTGTPRRVRWVLGAAETGCVYTLHSRLRSATHVMAVNGQFVIAVYTLRPIRMGEELCFDYNSVYVGVPASISVSNAFHLYLDVSVLRTGCFTTIQIQGHGRLKPPFDMCRTESTDEYRKAVCLCGTYRCRQSFLYFSNSATFQSV